MDNRESLKSLSRGNVCCEFLYLQYMKQIQGYQAEGILGSWFLAVAMLLVGDDESLNTNNDIGEEKKTGLRDIWA